MEKDTMVADRYRLINFIGRGSFGEVWMAEDTALDNMHVAVKLYISLDSGGQKEFSEEYKVAYGLNHQNLLKADHYSIWNHHPFLVMKYCSRGSVAGQLGGLSEMEIWKFIHDVSAGLAYLHMQTPPIIHQDIKPENILIDDHGNFMITDFGISRKLRSTMRKQSKRVVGSGALAYMGPERFLANPIAVKSSDIWSLGVSIYELATGELPFAGQGGGMLNHGAEMPTLDPVKWSDNLNTVMQLCLAKETWDRPTAEELMEFSRLMLKGEMITWYQFKNPGAMTPPPPKPSVITDNLEPETGTESSTVGDFVTPEVPQKKKNKWLVPGLCILGVAIVTFFAIWAFIKPDSNSGAADDIEAVKTRYASLASMCENNIKNGSSENYTNLLEANAFLDSLKSYESKYPELAEAGSKSESLAEKLTAKSKEAAEEWAVAGKSQLEDVGDLPAALQYYHLAMLLNPGDEYKQTINDIVARSGCTAGLMAIRDLRLDGTKLIVNYIGTNSDVKKEIPVNYVINAGGQEIKGTSNITIEPGTGRRLNINLPDLPAGDKEITLSSNGIEFYSQKLN
ncbi:MAG: serine/threonine-protein kinase [Clostridium sp.]|nr:serine/threonine-protein kinase [Prevotella sp.]MCM1428482.1 serine/threonine-protein kinase [Clostridium sp.]MCM1475888.1 serine/threonine-protein kinase [Muribaculaceae bacterium]